MFHLRLKLFKMCINDNMYIANGRVGHEKHIGKVTSKESSTGDYFIHVWKVLY
jgi:hypothetical protein